MHRARLAYAHATERKYRGRHQCRGAMHTRTQQQEYSTRVFLSDIGAAWTSGGHDLVVPTPDGRRGRGPTCMIASCSRALSRCTPPAVRGASPAASWSLEPKLDGWRALVYLEDGTVAVLTRRGRTITEQVPELAELAKPCRATVRARRRVPHSIAEYPYLYLHTR